MSDKIEEDLPNSSATTGLHRRGAVKGRGPGRAPKAADTEQEGEIGVEVPAGMLICFSMRVNV